jgi:D-3-phosphoglycerate dehydrogenase
MTGTRPTALVTAPFRGEGMATLESLADVVYDPWIEHVPLRLYDGPKLAARIADEGELLIVESIEQPGDLPLRDRLVPLTNNVDVAADQGRIPVPAPGRNADAVAEPRSRCCSGEPVPRAADGDVRAGKVYAGGKIPYQRYRAWQLAGRTVGIVGLGAVGRAAKWRFEGLGLRVLSFDPYNPDATHSDNLEGMLAECDVVSVHAVVTPETEQIMGAAQFSAMKPGASYLHSARAKLHDTDALVDALRSDVSSAPARPLRGREPRHRPSAVLDDERRAHAAHRRGDLRHRGQPLEADCGRRRAILRGDKPVNCVNPRCCRR